MPHTIVLHIQNADAVIAESEDLPSLDDTLIKVRNPRRLDGKDLHYIGDNTIMIYWPIDKINFIEVLATDEDEEIIGFVRD